jgi:hypothetical protein
MLGAEALGERDVLGTALVALVVGEAGAQGAHVVIVERVTRPEVVGDFLDQLIGDRPRAHGAKSRAVGPGYLAYSGSGRRTTLSPAERPGVA